MLGKIATEHETLHMDKRPGDISAALKRVTADYEAIRSEVGRDAVNWNPFRYWAILILAMVPEFFINWDSFTRIPWFQGIPAFAFGSVVLVAMFFAYSSHIVGMILKQGQDWFGGKLAATEWTKSFITLVFAVTLFMLAFGMVTYGRKLLVDDLVSENELTSGAGMQTGQLIFLYLGALLGNVGVYLFGLIWSSTQHNSIRGFVELREERDRLQAKINSIYEKRLTPRTRRHILAARAQKDQLQQRERQQATHLPGYSAAREMFSELNQVDQKVVGLLTEYKTKLIAEMRDMGSPGYFQFSDIMKADQYDLHRLEPDEYSAFPIELRY